MSSVLSVINKSSTAVLLQTFQHQRLATRAQPAQQPLSAVLPQLHIWNVPLLPSSASAPPATPEPLAATVVSDTRRSYRLPSNVKYCSAFST